MTQTRADDAAAASRGNLRKVEQQRKQATGSAASHFASIFVARKWQKRRLNQRRRSAVPHAGVAPTRGLASAVVAFGLLGRKPSNDIERHDDNTSLEPHAVKQRKIKH